MKRNMISILLLCAFMVTSVACTRESTNESVVTYTKAAEMNPDIHDGLTEDLHYDIIQSIGESNDNYSIFVETWDNGDEEPRHNEYSNISINNVMADADCNIVFTVEDMCFLYDIENKDLHIWHNGDDVAEIVYHNNFAAMLVNEDGDEYPLAESEVR